MTTFSQDITQRLIAEAEQMKQDAEEIRLLCSLTIPEYVPDERQCRIWLRRYCKDIVAESITVAAEWIDNEQQQIDAATNEGKELPEGINPNKTASGVFAWATKVMINKTQGQGESTGKKWTKANTKRVEPVRCETCWAYYATGTTHSCGAVR